MNAETVLDDLRAAGLSVSTSAAGLLVQPASRLTSDLRDGIRLHKRALTDLLACTRAEEEEIRRLLGALCGESHPDFDEAVQAALANPQIHLRGLRASVRVEGAR